jgi:hypothetical protein
LTRPVPNKTEGGFVAVPFYGLVEVAFVLPLGTFRFSTASVAYHAACGTQSAATLKIE